MGKLPALQFYPGDWKKDPGVRALSYHDRGVWFEILLLMHESEQRGKLLLNGQRMPYEALAVALGLDNQNLTNTITTLLQYGVASLCEKTGALMSRRMVRDEMLRQVRTEAGKLGGNPDLLKQKRTSGDKQKRTPSISSSKKMKGVFLNQEQADQFAEFWETYPLKKSKGHAEKAFVKALQASSFHSIMDGLQSYLKEQIEPQYRKHPATWLNARSWEDEQPAPAKKKEPMGFMNDLLAKKRRGEITEEEFQDIVFQEMNRRD